MNPKHPTTAYRLDLIRKAIDGKALHSHDIAAAVGINERWVKKYIDHLMELDQARVVDWQPYGVHHYLVAMYHGGPGRSVPKPPRSSPAIIKARYLKNLKADPERRELLAKKDNARRRKTPQQHPLVAALFKRPIEGTHENQ